MSTPATRFGRSPEGTGNEDAPTPLNDAERQLLKRLFSDFFEVPGSWKTDLKAELERDPPILGKATLAGQGTGPPGPQGVPGPAGPPGPPGDSNAAYAGEWNWTTKVADANTAGQVGLNTADWTTATQLNLNEQKGDNTDVTPYFGKVAVGDRFHVRQKTDASRYGEYQVTGAGTDHGTWWSWPISWISSGGNLPNGNAAVIVTMLAQGPAAGDKNYVHNQVTPAPNWTVAHGLNKYPAVAVVDSGGTMIIPDVNYVDPNTVALAFAAATSGKVYVN